MINVVEAAMKLEGEDVEWLIIFSSDQKLVGPVKHIQDDIYRITNGRNEYYFDAAQVLYMTQRRT
ncbi:hypothetical protein PQR62_12225 [Herbaspirillum lusitanum]|uniref:Uncharacterized protein n=1 Tax=Herbaspirillum lusitanum TaxID=213312 RepID=A0ABW9AAL7_9BURK